MIGIYKITNPKGKVYIGKSINVEKRLEYYKYISPRKSQHKLNNSIAKYGFQNHTLEIIEQCEESKLNEREIYWIEYYNSVKSGLNLMYGGEGGRQSQEVKNKKSISMTGKKHSLSTREKMSKSKKGHSMYNDEWRKSISEANKGGTSSKPVLQYDKRGNFIKEWSSKVEAAKALNMNNVSISNNTTGLIKSAGGYIWKNK
jgi:group I intron endonuclease